MERKIHNQEKFRQQILFEGLESGKVSYTDIDFIREIDNKYLIIGDVKSSGQKLPIGQKLTIERLCDKDWKFSLGVIVEHNVPVTDDVYLKDCSVVEIYKNKKWITAPGAKSTNPMKFSDLQKNLSKMLDTNKI